MDESESLIINGEEENGDEFYEKIEAPKFVDLTAPDHYQPGDDRSWFCLRVGCDQNHEEEMDSEAIYKKFVLQVMAARSPNIRLRRALCRKGLDLKCPQTVPAKPSKSRITQMALISSISKRIVDTKVKVKPLSKQNETPKAKAKRASMIAKSLTTPRSKKQLENPEAFRSVRNQKTTASEAANSRVVAKTLVFDSPNKGVRTKNSVEMNTPLRNLCAGMKKLEITSGKKQVLGYDRPLPSDTSRKKFRGREVKSRVFDGLLSQNDKVQHAKSSKCLEKNRKANKLQENHDHVCRERVENDVKKMEIEEKTTNISEGVCSLTSSGDENIPGGNLTATETLRPPSDQNNVDAVSDATSIDSNSGDDIVFEFHPPSEIVERDVKGDESEAMANDDKENSLASDDNPPGEIMERDVKGNEREAMENDDKENSLASDDNPPGEIMERDVKGNKSEAMENDDKENSLASDDNRELGVKTIHKEHKIHSKHEIPKCNRKTTIAKSKQSKENSTPASNGAQYLKLKKPKSTNPKPFRLRTDERGVLKEANSEKKQRPMQPLSEIATVPKVAVGNSFETHHFALLRDAKCTNQNENHGSQKEIQRRDQQPTSRMKTAKERMGRKTTSTPQRHTISSKQKLVALQQKGSHDKSTPKLENSLRRTKLPSVRNASSGHEIVSSVLKTGQLGTIKETSPTISRRCKTIPKEPNFQTMHKPKSCTKGVA